MNVTHLECAACGHRHEARRLLNLCTQCGKPLLVRYDLKAAAVSLTKDSLKSRGPDLWRYRELLPVDDDEKLLPFGEATPGATGLELLLSLALKWAEENVEPSQQPLSRALAKITNDAAQADLICTVGWNHQGEVAV